MRPTQLAAGLLPFAAVAAVAVALAGEDSPLRGAEAAGTAGFLRDATETLKRTSFSAEVLFDRRWEGGEVEVRLAVAVAPPDAIRVRFLGVKGRHGERTFGFGGEGFGGFTVSTRSPLEKMPLVRDPALAGRNYRRIEEGTREVGGRPARVVTLTPRRAGPPSVRIAVDQETGLPVERREIGPMGADGADRGGWRLESLRVPADPALLSAPAFALPPLDSFRGALGTVTDVAGAAAAGGIALHAPGWLPAGFSVHQIRRAETGEGPIVRLLCTDGIAEVSVVEWPEGRDVWGAFGRERVAEAAKLAEGLPPEMRAMAEPWIRRFAGGNGSGGGGRGERPGSPGRGRDWSSFFGGRGRGAGGKAEAGGEGEKAAEAGGSGHGRRGARLRRGGVEIRVVGPLPEEDLQRIAEAMGPVNVSGGAQEGGGR